MPNKDFTRAQIGADEVLAYIAVDTDDDGKPDAIGVCNADGSSVGTAATVLDDMEDAAPWSAISGLAADNLAESTTHKIGSKSLEFDKAAGHVDAGVERTFNVPFDLGTAEATRKSIQFAVNLSSLTDVVSAWVRLGTDGSNYAEFRVPVADLASGWNRCTRHLLDNGWTQAGTGLNTAALTYLAVGVEFSAAGDTLADILFDNVLFLEHVEVESKVLLSTSVTVGVVDANMRDGGGTALTSTTVGADRALDVNVVQAVGGAGLATEATLASMAAAVATAANQATGNASLATVAGDTTSMDGKMPADPAREGGNLATAVTHLSTVAGDTTSIDAKVSTAANQATANGLLATIDSDTSDLASTVGTYAGGFANKLLVVGGHDSGTLRALELDSNRYLHVTVKDAPYFNAWEGAARPAFAVHDNALGASTGLHVLGSRYESSLSKVSTDGDWTRQKATIEGIPLTRPEHPTSTTHGETFAAAQTDYSPANGKWDAPGAGKRLVIVGYDFSAAAAQGFSLQDEDDNELIGKVWLPATGNKGKEKCYIPLPTNKALELTTDNAVNHSATVSVITEQV